MEKILVKLKFFGIYKCHSEIKEILVPKNSNVFQLIDSLKIKDSVDLWVLINGEPSKKDKILYEGDEVTFFQPVGGGN